MASNPAAPVAPMELGFCVADMDRSLAFYRGLLGLEQVSDIAQPAQGATGSAIAASTYRVVRLELATGERIKLFSPQDRPAPQRPDQAAPPLSRVGYAFLTLIVADLEATVAHLAGHGVAARPPGIRDLRDNVRIALIDDPDGNVIELVQYYDLKAYRADI